MERPQSGWLDFLDWVRAPGRVVMNLDRPEYARGYAADFLAGPLDAVVPGDLIDSQVPTDTREYNPWVEAAANPLTYAGLHPAVRKAIPKLATETRGLIEKSDVGKRTLGAARRTFGWEEYEPIALRDRWYKTASTAPGPRSLPIPGQTLDTRSVLGQLEGVRNTVALSQLSALDEMGKKLGRLSTQEDEALASVIDNLDWGGGKPVVLDPTHKGTTMDLPQQIAAAKGRLQKLAGLGQVDRASIPKLEQYIDAHYGFTEKQLAEMQAGNAISGTRNRPDYLARVYDGIDGPNTPSKPREYQDADALAEFLRSNPDVKLERRWSERMVTRAESQGRLLARAKLRTQLTNEELAKRLLNPDDIEAQTALKTALEDAKPGSDTFARIKYELYGAEPQGPVQDAMRTVNRWFKPAAVYGVGPFVRIGSITRNWLTGYWQMASTPEGRAALLSGGAGDHFRTLFDAFDDGVIKNLGLKRISKGEVTGALDAIEDAARASGGQMDRTLKMLRSHPDQIVQEAANALENGVMQGFVMSEDLAKAGLQMRSMWDPRYWLMPGASPVADIGSKFFGGLEQRMRFSMYLNRRKAGESAADAAKGVQDTFLDYSRNSGANRELRTWLPFAQFITQTIPQQGKFLATTPAALPAVAALYGGEDLPGWAREQAHVGNVLPGMAPTDVMNMIPDVTGSESFEAFQQSTAKTLGALHPLLGVGIGFASGRDTFTGKPYMEDARLPFRDPKTTERNALDTAWGLGEDAGLLMPLSGPAAQARSLGKMEPGAAALRYATGINTLPEDPLRAEADKLRATIEADPRVKSFERYYTKSDDASLDAALKRLEEVRKELAEKTKITAPGQGPGAVGTTMP